MEYKRYLINIIVVNAPFHITGGNGVNGVLFENQGNTNVNVNGRVILPGASWGWSGNFGEVDYTNYAIGFDAGNVADPVNNLIISRKTYQ